MTRGPRQAHIEGFDLHANVWVGARDRARREQLCRYLLRPPLADDRLRLLGDGRVRVQLKRAWSDGTTHLLFEPVEFLEKLAALTPRPAINLILYHGVLAPHACWRPAVVAFGRPEGDAALAPHEPMDRAEAERYGAARSRYWTWVALMRRAFDLDVLRCPRCAGRMQLIATIDDPAVIHRILAHLALSGARDDDLHRIDVLPADLQHVLVTADESQVAVGPHHAHVPGVKPAAAVDGTRGILGLLVVARRHHVAAGEDLPRHRGGLGLVAPSNWASFTTTPLQNNCVVILTRWSSSRLNNMGGNTLTLDRIAYWDILDVIRNTEANTTSIKFAVTRENRLIGLANLPRPTRVMAQEGSLREAFRIVGLENRIDLFSSDLKNMSNINQYQKRFQHLFYWTRFF